MDRKTRREMKKQIKKMQLAQIVDLMNHISARERFKNDLRNPSTINFKKED